MPPGEACDVSASASSSNASVSSSTTTITTTTTTASAYPVTFGLAADLGQTAASEANMHLLQRMLREAGDSSSSVVLIAGDLSYADGWLSRWDSYGRMMEPLTTEVAVMTTSGNHEVESTQARQLQCRSKPPPDAPPAHKSSCTHGSLLSSLPHRTVAQARR